ncbi:hypothetical protein PC121_g11458 [Phytophthora cactorum]|nr:hypothetical protein PC121_g11458 [Phytophthora cactorum]
MPTRMAQVVLKNGGPIDKNALLRSGEQQCTSTEEGEDGGTIDDEVASEEDEDPEMTKVEVDGEMVRLDDELDVDTVIDLGSVAKVRAATKVTDQGSREENEGQTSRKTEKSSHIRRSGRDGSHTGR